MQDAQQAGKRIDETPDFAFRHAAGWRVTGPEAGELGLCRDPLGLDFTAPGGDQGRVGSAFQGGAVAGELAVASLQRRADNVGADVEPVRRFESFWGANPCEVIKPTGSEADPGGVRVVRQPADSVPPYHGDADDRMTGKDEIRHSPGVDLVGERLVGPSVERVVSGRP